MARTQSQLKPHQTLCSNCAKVTAENDIINFGSMEKGYRELCGACFNAEAASLGGLDKFQHLHFQPVRLVDCAGKSHEFHFRTRLFGSGVAIDALEIRKGEPVGYQF